MKDYLTQDDTIFLFGEHISNFQDLHHEYSGSTPGKIIQHVMDTETMLRNTFCLDTYVEIIKRLQDRIPARLTYIQENQDTETEIVQERIKFLMSLYNRINEVNHDYYESCDLLMPHF